MKITTKSNEENRPSLDITGIGSAQVQRKARRALEGWKQEQFQMVDAWSRLKEGEIRRLPDRLLILADLSNMARTVRKLTELSQLAGATAAVRLARPFLVVLLRNDKDISHMGMIQAIEDLFDERLKICSLVEAGRRSVDPAEKLEECLKRVAIDLDPLAILKVSYSQTNRSLWIQFGDGLSGSLDWSALQLESRRPALRPESATIDRADPFSIAVLEEKGKLFEIDSGVLRGLLDKEYGKRLQESVTREAARVGERLKSRRLERKLTQQELARLIGMDQALISKLERGVHSPRVDTLAKYAEGLGMSIPDVLRA